HVGIRAHQIAFLNCPDAPNALPAWVAHTSETPHRMTVFLKLGQPPADADDYHLRAEVFKEKWATIKNRPLPWSVGLPPAQLLLLRP
ncbi:MAG TPA: hypothetical protein VEZ50_15315, partial [Nodosilinea sp.]|nr:hypothetical protein [Nodosilinea sp.]